MPVFLPEGCIKVREVFKAQVQVNIARVPVLFLDEVVCLGKPLVFEPAARGGLESFHKIPLEAGQAPPAEFGEMTDGRIVVKIL